MLKSIQGAVWMMIALSCGVGSMAHAQNFPTRPLRLVVAFPAGGPIDIVGRMIAPKMSELIGQQVLVDNRAGANGIIGSDSVAKSAPDGYTMVLASPGAVAISPAIYPKMPFETLRDFSAIALVSTTPEVLVVHPSLPVKTLKELVALATAHPGQLNMASTGTGGLPHLALELLMTGAKIKTLHIPYKGAAPAVSDLIAGHSQGMFADLPVLLPHIQAKKLRALGVTAPERSPLLPDVGTMREQGLPMVEAINWYGILTAAKTPAPIVAKLNEVVVKTLADKAVAEKLIARGAQPVGSKPEEFAAYLKADLERWAKLAKTTNIKVD